MIEAVKTANCIMTDEEFEEAFDTESPPTFFDFFSFQTKDFNILAFISSQQCPSGITIGSLRIITRNWTFDDLFEATLTS